MPTVVLPENSSSCMCFSDTTLWQWNYINFCWHIHHWGVIWWTKVTRSPQKVEWWGCLCVQGREGSKGTLSSATIPKIHTELVPSGCCKVWAQCAINFLKSSVGSSGKQLTPSTPKLWVWAVCIHLGLFIFTHKASPFPLSGAGLAWCHALQKYSS